VENILDRGSGVGAEIIQLFFILTTGESPYQVQKDKNFEEI
jgi:hypothetical protein